MTQVRLPSRSTPGREHLLERVPVGPCEGAWAHQDNLCTAWNINRKCHHTQEAEDIVSRQKEGPSMATEPVDEIDVEPPEDTGQEYEEIPTGAYVGKLTGFKIVDRPAWLVAADAAKFPDKDPDGAQWQWQFEVVEGGYAGEHITKWTNRSWHERSNGGKIAAAILGVPKLERGIKLSTRDLMEKPCQIWVVGPIEKPDGTISHSRIDKVLPMPKERRPRAPQQAPQPASAPPATDMDDDADWENLTSQTAPESDPIPF